jgi:hypothetical protein
MELERAIEQHRERLHARHPQVQRCEVTVEDRPPRRYERKRFHVRLDIDWAGRHLVVNREHDDDPACALGEAFSAAQWKLDAAQASRHLG